MRHKNTSVVAVVVVLLFSLVAFAKNNNKDEGKINVDEPLQVGSMELQPGHYKVEWNGTGPQVNVSIMKYDKTVATVPAKVVNHANPSPYNALVTTASKNNQPEQLQEIDFNKRTLALVLEPNQMANR